MALSVGVSIILAVLAAYLVARGQGFLPFHPSWVWFQAGTLQVRFGFLLDAPALLMLCVVTLIGCLVHVFSTVYMRTDASRSRYFAALSFFMFSMLGIVLADNLLLLFMFWELVGFSSYVLIAHYWDQPAAAQASKKAFIVNRVGDFAFLLGIIRCYWVYGTWDIAQLSAYGQAFPHALHTGIALLLMGGFVGKSAQFPLHVWLPDAMAGPTPVSALIHAATMVAAGIYMMARIFALLTPQALQVVLAIGCITALAAALCAVTQDDIKKVLAYSTLSQLGYMTVALGLGYPGLALFHLTTHASFKALLFLGAAAIIYQLHHEQSLTRMGGLARRMPLTATCFAVGALALCAFYGSSGYFSKDAILAVAHAQCPLVFYAVSAGAWLTAFYVGRLYCLAFLGTPRHAVAAQAKEPPALLGAVLLVLAALSVLSGYVRLWPSVLASVIGPEYHLAHTYLLRSPNFIHLSGITACLVGWGGAWLLYAKTRTPHPLGRSALYRFLAQAGYVDALYRAYVVRIQQPLAQLTYLLDVALLSGLVVRGFAGFWGLLSLGLNRMHQGGFRAYGLGIILGVLALCYLF
jgi:NADH-quinone oxidoreductase subunit L